MSLGCGISLGSRLQSVAVSRLWGGAIRYLRHRLPPVFGTSVLVAAIAAIFAAGASYAQTPRGISVANSLRICLLEKGGFRDAPRAADLQASVAVAPGPRWNVSEIAPGVFRLTSHLDPIIVEIKLPDAGGSGHCLAFGGGLTPQDAIKAADTYVEFGFGRGLQPMNATNGALRRYHHPGLDFGYELVAYEAPGIGPVVGLAFTNVTANRPQKRSLSAGDPKVSRQNVARVLGWATAACAVSLGNDARIKQIFEGGGFEFGHGTGNRPPNSVYFYPDNSVSAKVAGAICEIDTRYLSGMDAVSAVGAALSQHLPGQFRNNGGTSGNCATFSRNPGAGGPLVITVSSLPPDRRTSCTPDGTARVQFVIPG